MQSRRVIRVLFSSSMLALFSLPTLADAVSAPQITLTGYSGGGVNDLGLFDFRAWGEVNIPYLGPYQGAPTNISFTWSQAFVLPASPANDYFEVTRVNTYSTGGDIIIDGQVYSAEDNFDLIGLLSPDPNLYTYPHSKTVRMELTGPIFVYVFGSFSREYDESDCCHLGEIGPSVNLTSFEQFLQIERFHPDGTLDPLPSAPEPATSALMLLGLCAGIAIALWQRKTDQRSGPC